MAAPRFRNFCDVTRTDTIVNSNNDAKVCFARIGLLRIRPRPGGLPHLEMFTWQNLTPAERVTRSGRPGYPPWRVTPPIM